ncbi:hypothetical protein MVEN_01793000 [Mycena venus]|uniref:Uncharacterized protein n=1 Tax=Mycena venus TaxID=2733690 RepID=A0A8H7CN45_9AGAR|nr:hypothetical protein MVEN_01793000 [Mycena venus]
MLTLDDCLTAALDTAVPRSNPQFHHYLQNRGLAGLIKAANAELVHDYRTTGRMALDVCIFEYFVKHQVPHSHRDVVQASVLSQNTFDHLVSEGWSTTPSDNESIEIHADVIYIFVGAMSAIPELNVGTWFRDAFGPIVDDVAFSYVGYLENAASVKKGRSGARRDRAKQKAPQYRLAVSMLTR